MSNPLFNALNNNSMGAFPQFMAVMRGKNPSAILNEMLKSGKINQHQLDIVQAKANEMRSSFEQFKGMFGF